MGNIRKIVDPSDNFTPWGHGTIVYSKRLKFTKNITMLISQASGMISRITARGMPCFLCHAFLT